MKKQNEKFGQLLQAARERKKLSLRAVERATGISNAYLSQLESGKIRQPSPVVLHKLGDLYEIPYVELLELVGYPVPEPSTESARYSRLASRIGPITDEEEEALIEYLEFMRSRRRRGKLR